VADLLTKPLAGPKQTKFVQMLLHHYVWYMKRRELWRIWKNWNLYLFTFVSKLTILSNIFPVGFHEFPRFPNISQWGLRAYIT
jgi:hypothetical protein